VAGYVRNHGIIVLDLLAWRRTAHSVGQTRAQIEKALDALAAAGKVRFEIWGDQVAARWVRAEGGAQ
jgi:hypothetical protein